MTEPPMTLMVQYHLTALEKLSAGMAWLAAGLLFFTLGWWAMAPDDPLGPVTLFTRSGVLPMLIQTTGLAMVAGVAGTLLAGRSLTDAGVFAAGVGLVVVSFRGADASSMLLQGTSGTVSSERAVAMKFVLEGVLWLLMIVFVAGVTSLVYQWCFGLPAPLISSTGETNGASNHPDSDDQETAGRFHINPPEPAAGMAGFVLLNSWRRMREQRGRGRSRDQVQAIHGSSTQGQRHLRSRTTGDVRSLLRSGPFHMVVAGAAAVVLMLVLGSGQSNRAVTHGQSCFLVAASVGIGCWMAQRLAPIRSTLWPLLSVGIVILLGYSWAAVQAGGGSGSPPRLPASVFLRVLPVQYAAVGSATAVFVRWYARHPVFARGGPDRVE